MAFRMEGLNCSLHRYWAPVFLLERECPPISTIHWSVRHTQVSVYCHAQLKQGQLVQILFIHGTLETLALTALAMLACSLSSQDCWFSCSWAWSTIGCCQRAAWWTVPSAASSQSGHRGRSARARAAPRVNKPNLRTNDYTNGHIFHQLIPCASLFQIGHSPSCWVVQEYIRMH